MSKAKTNALDALRALIAERQQYEQWMNALDAKREGTPEHVFERVQADYQGRLERVVTDIRGHAEELQLSISTLSSRLVEVARDEDTRREGLQEAELRAAVGEYEPEQWEELKAEAEEGLAKAAADRASLDAQLGELRAIQKLSEVGSVGTVPGAGEESALSQPGASQPAGAQPTPVQAHRHEQESSPPRPFVPPAAQASVQPSASQAHASQSSAAQVPAPPAPAQQNSPARPAERSTGDGAEAGRPAERASSQPGEKGRQEGERIPLEPVAAAASAMTASQQRPRSTKTPPGGVSAARRSEPAKPDQSKTLKCPECGTPNYPTEWYCERCGGELATM